MKELIDVFRMEEISAEVRAYMIIELGKFVNMRYSTNVSEPLVYKLVSMLSPNHRILEDQHYVELHDAAVGANPDGWVKTKDELPPPGTLVWFYSPSQYTGSGSYCKGSHVGDHFVRLGGGVVLDVTHWIRCKPLPEPPKDCD